MKVESINPKRIENNETLYFEVIKNPLLANPDLQSRTNGR